MKHLLISTCLLLGLLCASFTGRKPAEKTKSVEGTYGFCNCDNSSPGTLKFNLSLNDDNTFHYVNNTDPAKPVDVNGTWERKGNTILLKDYTSKFPIHSKWKIADNPNCIKSRKGMEFTRLCNIEPCH